MDEEIKSGLVYPCDYPIYIIGPNRVDFRDLVITVLSDHIEGFEPGHLSEHPSSEDRYISLSLTFLAKDQEQVDNIYRALSSDSRVLMII